MSIIQMATVHSGVAGNNGTQAAPFDSAWESKQLGYGDGYYFVNIAGTTRNVYVNNSENDGAWILVTRARNNSTCHHGTGGSGGDTSPINPTGGCHSYSDSFINTIMGNRQYTGNNPNCYWRAYSNHRGWIYGYKTGGFCSNCAANGTGWDLINPSYANSYNTDTCGNDGSRGFGDHHCNGSYFAYNRHNNNNGFSHDGMSDSDGLFYVRH